MASLCVTCQARPALTRIRGRYFAAKHHTLCGRCWRSLRASMARKPAKVRG